MRTMKTKKNIIFESYENLRLGLPWETVVEAGKYRPTSIN